MRCWVCWPRAPTCGLSAKGARRTTSGGPPSAWWSRANARASRSASRRRAAIDHPGAAPALPVRPHAVLDGPHDRRRLPPVRDARVLLGDREAVLVHQLLVEHELVV